MHVQQQQKQELQSRQAMVSKQRSKEMAQLDADISRLRVDPHHSSDVEGKLPTHAIC